MIYYLIYMSKAAKLMDDETLQDILNESRSWNKSHGLTGMLIYIEGRFLMKLEGRFCQVLEGSKEEVEYIFEKIKKDKRHKNVLLLTESTIDERNFKDWTMGYNKVDHESFKASPDYFELNDDFLKNKVKLQNVPLNYLKTFYNINNEIGYKPAI